MGLVYYADDPDKKVFRRVYPVYAQGETDAVLDDPQWVTVGLDGIRPVILAKVPDADVLALFPNRGAITAPATLNGIALVTPLVS